MTVHSEARILYTESKNFEGMDFDSMPLLMAAIDLNTGQLLASRGNFAEIYQAFEKVYVSKSGQYMKICLYNSKQVTPVV